MSTNIPNDFGTFQKSQDFSLAVERLLKLSNDLAEAREARIGKSVVRMTYMEAILETAEKFGIETELAGTYISSEIKEKFQAECENLKVIPRTAKLFADTKKPQKKSTFVIKASPKKK